jgi:hypothetical protein
VHTARYVLHSSLCPHSTFKCFVWIWEQTAIISLYSIDWMAFIAETECVYYAVRSTFYPHIVFMCFVWIWEQTAIISLYSIDWLAFIAETECVCRAARSTIFVLPTQIIYVFSVDLRTNTDYVTVQHLLVGFYNWDGKCLLRGTTWVFQPNTSKITGHENFAALIFCNNCHNSNVFFHTLFS